MRTLTAGHAERTERAGGHHRRLLVAPTAGPQMADDRLPLTAADVDAVGPGLPSRAGRPSVADLPAEPSVAVVDYEQPRVYGLPQPTSGLTLAGQRQCARTGRQPNVDRH